MMVVNPARAEDRIVLRTDLVAELMEAVGTLEYPQACFRVLGESFDVDHWALFRYGEPDTVRCIATASRFYEHAAEQNISVFVNRCHKVDPALGAYRQRVHEHPWLVKMAIDDIYDRQYRRCFEATHVQERLSFFATAQEDVIQLCVYRGSVQRTFSSPEMRLFASLSRLIIASASKHDSFGETYAALPRRLDAAAVEQRLSRLPAGLSKREQEVCALAVLGKTILETAHELDIERTSVVTYRQRAYQKLRIARQSDLIALVYDIRNGPVQ